MFEQVFNFILSKPDNVVLIVALIFGLVTFFRTGDIKKSIKTLMEVDNTMKYKLPDDRHIAKQEFTPYKKVYKLDEVNNVLVDTGDTINIQEQINSMLETSLDNILSKFLNMNNASTIQEVDDVAVVERRFDKLDVYTEYISKAEDYRDKFNLPIDMSIEDIYKHISQEAKNMQEKLNKITQPKIEEVKNETQKD